MSGEITRSDWYTLLVDDCKSIVNIGVQQSRFRLIETYHQLGQRIVDDEHLEWNARGNGETLSGLSKFTGINTRDLYRAVQFYKKYPDVMTVPEGMNISWNKIVTKYLPDTPPEEKEPPDTCPTCGQIIRKK